MDSITVPDYIPAVMCKTNSTSCHSTIQTVTVGILAFMRQNAANWNKNRKCICHFNFKTFQFDFLIPRIYCKLHLQLGKLAGNSCPLKAEQIKCGEMLIHQPTLSSAMRGKITLLELSSGTYSPTACSQHGFCQEHSAPDLITVFRFLSKIIKIQQEGISDCFSHHGTIWSSGVLGNLGSTAVEGYQEKSIPIASDISHNTKEGVYVYGRSFISPQDITVGIPHHCKAQWTPRLAPSDQRTADCIMLSSVHNH